ncbi:MAG: tRNA uridine-5-carboxymethylaminomethyl(34) synthesis GTPase MnmE [Rhodobacter sp.]|nr:tRNA uridine-5-carboxymethylaminomethyl(34) synthesis GTPase MnmE [Rhodobacter sp.]MCA3493485.1 tRNA uridine-5-carboxymethylaminomethyl(34) synthesis GTPase MnmE [Rhodobacter sp.]MCA3499100.1 tRNA uridine-5-carboxymethylaminomethyl(34) synthesis GTPase MnmE [Rhodobacter sp.]MCA3502685.1 tRNA uridine-5-carboxymethylaminomethyl(34) synthesis GTPase MnmE [Rhodobacter sp.]MCA3515571.1 tRNA uridine-5-carboxymethylaminomethyl(34) synthesis GTPase MnmE [Rhodobacter sp.]
MDTIFALATARGKAGVAIIRISGPASHDAVRHLAGDVPEMRRAVLRTLRSGGEVLDQGLVLTFCEGSGFTGERAAELQLHGSTAVTSAVLKVLSGLPGLRQAEPGEFTRRALENDRLDLAQVEGLADLIDAETEIQRKQALRVLSGAIGKRAQLWRDKLIRTAALLEATIDFADEDVPVDVAPEVLEILNTLLAEFRAETDGVRIAERVRDGFEVAIIGRPNSGKSTLINMLAGREAALTSDVPGTTRDIVEVRMDLKGLAVTMLDTAGLRQTDDRIEQLGIGRARARAEAADLRVFLMDEAGLPDGMRPAPGDVVVRGKADLGASGPAVSGLTGEGVQELVDQISAELSGRVAGSGTLTRERHRVALMRGIDALEAARIEVSKTAARTEIAAEDIRAAIRALESLLGGIGVEAVLDEVFSRFCIGK